MKKTTQITSILTTNCTIVEAQADVETIREIFDHFPYRFLPVVDGLQLIGVILRDDFLQYYLTRWEQDHCAADIISKEMVKLGPHNTIEQAKEVFDSRVFDMIPVVDEDNDLMGILLRQDVEEAYVHALMPVSRKSHPFFRLFSF